MLYWAFQKDGWSYSALSWGQELYFLFSPSCRPRWAHALLIKSAFSSEFAVQLINPLAKLVRFGLKNQGWGCAEFSWETPTRRLPWHVWTQVFPSYMLRPLRNEKGTCCGRIEFIIFESVDRWYALDQLYLRKLFPQRVGRCLF
jgi:hypothetical protein